METCKALTNPSGLIYFPSALSESERTASAEARQKEKLAVAPITRGYGERRRREGDSNPRYSYPYGSLANCWFKPLTHLSLPSESLAKEYLSQKSLSIERGKNRKTCTKCKIIPLLFQPFQHVCHHPEILHSLFIEIRNLNDPRFYIGKKP